MLEVGRSAFLVVPTVGAASRAAAAPLVLNWLDDLGACPLGEASSDEPDFLFAGARLNGDYRGADSIGDGLADIRTGRKNTTSFQFLKFGLPAQPYPKPCGKSPARFERAPPSRRLRQSTTEPTRNRRCLERLPGSRSPGNPALCWWPCGLKMSGPLAPGCAGFANALPSPLQCSTAGWPGQRCEPPWGLGQKCSMSVLRESPQNMHRWRPPDINIRTRARPAMVWVRRALSQVGSTYRPGRPGPRTESVVERKVVR